MPEKCDQHQRHQERADDHRAGHAADGRHDEIRLTEEWRLESRTLRELDDGAGEDALHAMSGADRIGPRQLRDLHVDRRPISEHGRAHRWFIGAHDVGDLADRDDLSLPAADHGRRKSRRRILHREATVVPDVHPGTAHLDESRARNGLRSLDRLDEIRRGDTALFHTPEIRMHLHALGVSTVDGHLRDARNSQQPGTEGPVGPRTEIASRQVPVFR